MTTPLGSEYFKIVDSNTSREIYFGTKAVTIENIDDFMTGPSVRGQDTPNVWLKGSSAGTRVTGSAEYNMSIVVNGYYDLEDATADSLGQSIEDRLRLNISEIKKLAITPVAYNENNLLKLEWYGNPAAPEESKLLSYVHLLPSISVKMLNRYNARLVLTFVNPNGYWVGDEEITFVDYEIGESAELQLNHTQNIVNRGNISSNEVVMYLIGPQRYFKIIRDMYNTYDELELPDDMTTEYDVLELNIKKQFLNYYQFIDLDTPYRITGKIIAKSQGWLTLYPGDNNIYIDRLMLASAPVIILSRSCYV